ncbi:MAG: phenylacetate--CoA ligase family protein [Burkholderiaceae bacterium]
MTKPDVFDPREAHSADAREALLMRNLPGLLARAKAASGWARILADVDAAAVASRVALVQLPVTRKNDLKPLQTGAPPFGALTTTATAKLGRLFMSPGPIFDPEGTGEDFWRTAPALYAAGIRSGDVLQNCFSYHFTPAAFMIEGGARKLGCPVIPAGIGATEQQIEAIQQLKPAAYIGTPSFLRILIEKAQEAKADIRHLRNALVAAEALPPSLRAWFKEHGMTNVLQWYGTADLGCVAYETQTDGVVHPGMVLSEDLILEIVRPGTGDVCAPGEVGEIVITSFNPDYPLIRFGTGDLTKVLAEPSPCGRTNTRIAGWMGRADQTTKVRGMFVHPGQVADVVKQFGQVKRARLVVTGQMGQDDMLLKCESDAALPAELLQRIVDALRDVTKLRGSVEGVPLGSLPNDGKVIEDARSYQ